MFYFAKRFASFSALLILSTIGLYWISENVSPVYPEVAKPMEILEKKKQEIEVITLRNSHNRAIHFESMGMEGFHLWRGGADIFTAKYILRNLHSDLDSLEYVLVPIQGYVFDNSTSDYRSEKRREWYSLEQFGYDYLRGDAKLFWRARLVDPIVRPDHWRGVFYPLLSSVLRTREIKSTGWVGPRSTDHIDPGNMADEATARARKHIDIHKSSMTESPSLCERAISTFREMGNMIAPTVSLVLYNPPYVKSYSNYISKNTKCPKIKISLKKISNNKSNIIHLNMANVLPEKDSYKYFRDPDHLNLYGAKIVSSALADSLTGLPIKE